VIEAGYDHAAGCRQDGVDVEDSRHHVADADVHRYEAPKQVMLCNVKQ
jgi:hypothetical protein